MNSDLVKRAVRSGLVGGIAVIYLCAVGMVAKFDIRNLIGDVVTLGKVLLALPAFLAGFLAVRARIRGGQVESVSPRTGLMMGFLAGALTGGMTIGAVALVNAFPDGAVRRIFTSVSPALITIITFSQSVPLGAVILIVGGGVLGALGAGFRLSPQRFRRALSIGLYGTFLMALLQRFIPPMLSQLGFETPWLYSRSFGGLTKPGSVEVFVVATFVAGLWSSRSPVLKARLRDMPEEGRKGFNLIALVIILGLLLYLPSLVGSSLSQILGTVGIFMLMGLGLNIVVGYAGLLDLGYVAFFAVGAYFTAIFTNASLVTSLGDSAKPALALHLNFYAAIPLVILVAAFTGLLIGAPVLRLRGDYLAIVTLGFGEIARVLITSDWLQRFLGGAQGIRDITDARIANFSFRSPPQHFYYLVLAFVMLAIYVSWRLARSRIGRAWNAMREDEQVAEAMGISTIKYKLLAFAIGAAIGCLSGALLAVQLGSLSPASFQILISITALAIIILGGIGSIPGVIVGALFLIGIPQLLSEFEEFRLLIYGGVLIGIMILRPQGLIPNVRRSRELLEDERTQDVWLKGTGEASVDAAIAVGTTGAGEVSS
jgi:branched-chain amino acid transport system permease protein